MNRGRLFWEGVVIVISILLAFSIDAWWDERKDRIEEREILIGLEEEFRQNREIFEHQLQANLDMLVAMKVLLTAVHEGRWTVEGMSFDEALSQVLRPPTTDLGGGVLRAVMSGGRLPLISNKELRFKLAAWEGVLGEVLDDELTGRDLVFNTLLPYFIEHGVPLSRAWDGDDWGEWPIASTTLTADPEALQSLLADPSFQTILEARYVYWAHTTGEYESALDAIDEILAEIEQSR